MRKSALAAIACIMLLISGCVKDDCINTYSYTYYTPVYKTTAEVRANIRSNSPRPINKPGKIYVRGNYIFLNETDRGIHIIDNSNPSAPVNKAFIDIPGNVDIAVKGNILYADLYTDLVAIDISNPTAVNVTKIIDGVFPFRYYGNLTASGTQVISDWVRHDTTVVEDCGNRGGWWREKNMESQAFMSLAAVGSANGSVASASPYGAGGSMARFAVVNERLYTVSQNDLSAFNITNTAQPSFSAKTDVGWGIETIYPFKNNLFIGSTTGMFVFSITNPDAPVKTGQFTHVMSCDPVVADDTHAYVTLRSGTACRMGSNELDVLQLNGTNNPTLVKTYPFTNPHGLAKDGNTVLICDGAAGLKLYDASSPAALQSLSAVTGIVTYDVIAGGGKAIVVAKDGLYQYDYSNRGNPVQLSKLTVIN